MKKALIILTLAVSLGLFASLLNPIYAQVTWHTANQITIAWNAWPEKEPTDTVTYMVYVKFVDTGEILGTIDTPNGKAVLETASLEATVTLTAEGKYYFGVATKRVVEDGATLYSEINWSDTNGENTPNPFGVKFYVAPDPPLNLRRQ